MRAVPHGSAVPSVKLKLREAAPLEGRHEARRRTLYDDVAETRARRDARFSLVYNYMRDTRLEYAVSITCRCSRFPPPGFSESAELLFRWLTARADRDMLQGP